MRVKKTKGESFSLTSYLLSLTFVRRVGDETWQETIKLLFALVYQDINQKFFLGNFPLFSFNNILRLSASAKINLLSHKFFSKDSPIVRRENHLTEVAVEV